MVYFITDYGLIGAADATDASGIATVMLRSANSLPPDGFVEVCAQTADSGGAQIVACTQVLFSGHTEIENVSPTTINVADGGCQSFTFNVWDENQNPLTAGTRITVSSTSGTLLGDTDVELPDTQSQGPRLTSFSFSLCDANAGDGDPAVPVRIEIQVDSQNDDAFYVITGTIN
jgi:hypothetical protein